MFVCLAHVIFSFRFHIILTSRVVTYWIQASARLLIPLFIPVDDSTHCNQRIHFAVCEPVVLYTAETKDL